MLNRVPEHRRSDVVHLDTPNGNWTFNPLSGVTAGQEALATAELIEVFKKIWIDDWGPRLEHLLRNVLFTLFEMPGCFLGRRQSPAHRSRLQREHREDTEQP